MAYDVHITRKDDWSDTEGPAITREEWLAYIESDKDMLLEREAIVENDQGEAYSVKNETLAAWTAWSGREEGRVEAWMWHSAGNVMAKDPDREVICKMFLIADALGAKVQGDNGEVYNSIGEVDRADRPRRPWWKFW